MHIGGVLLYAGMELQLEPGDYLPGDHRIRFVMHTIVGCDATWVLLHGADQATAASPWRVRRVQVRIAALKRSLSLL